MVADIVDSLVVLMAVVSLYGLPTILAFARDVSSPWSVAVINVLLGWTLVGWVVALALALRDPRNAKSGASGAEAPDAPR